jgi:DNA polymerase-3 subunit beta
MKLTLITSNLQKKLTFLNHAISPKSQLPILLNVLLEAKGNILTLSSTDLEIGIEIKIPAEIEEEGSLTIPAKPFSELVNSLSESSLTIESKENKVVISTQKTKSVFQTISSEEFPRLYEEKGEQIAVLQQDNIQKDFGSVIFSASQDTTRPALSGVLVRKEEEGFLLVATDGYRLSLKHYKLTGSSIASNDSYIIPARVFKELLTMKDEKGEVAMHVSSGSNQVLFEQGDTILVGRLIEAEYPNYEKIIPADFSVSVTFDKEEMHKAVKICSIFARDAANIIKLSLQKDQIIISSQSPTMGENTVSVEAKLNGEENDIAFNARYLLDLFANLDKETIAFEMTGPLNPGVFKIDRDPSYLHLIMPIRVQA